MGAPPSTGPPDRHVLRLLERVLADDSLVAEIAIEPDSVEPRELRVELDASQFPASITGARLTIRWFESGDFSVQYTETHGEDSEWKCRWDRHPNPHSSRMHFHEPPDGRTIAELPWPSTHPIDVSAMVIAWISERVEQLWGDA